MTSLHSYKPTTSDRGLVTPGNPSNNPGVTRDPAVSPTFPRRSSPDKEEGFISRYGTEIGIIGGVLVIVAIATAFINHRSRANRIQSERTFHEAFRQLRELRETNRRPNDVAVDIEYFGSKELHRPREVQTGRNDVVNTRIFRDLSPTQPRNYGVHNSSRPPLPRNAFSLEVESNVLPWTYPYRSHRVHDLNFEDLDP